MYDINIYNKYIYNTFISREPSEHEQSPSNRDIEFGRIFRITSRLAFSIHVDQRQTKLEIMRQRDVYFFSSTFHESYVSFCEDDGPVNLSAVAQFCWYVRSKLTDPRLEGRTCVYYAKSNSTLRSNAIFLLAAFLVWSMATRLSRQSSVLSQWAPGTVSFLIIRGLSCINSCCVYICRALLCIQRDFLSSKRTLYFIEKEKDHFYIRLK